MHEVAGRGVAVAASAVAFRERTIVRGMSDLRWTSSVLIAKALAAARFFFYRAVLLAISFASMKRLTRCCAVSVEIDAPAAACATLRTNQMDIESLLDVAHSATRLMKTLGFAASTHLLTRP